MHALISSTSVMRGQICFHRNNFQFLLSRNEVEAVFRRSWTAWRPNRNLPLTTTPTSSPVCSRASSIPTVSQPTWKSIQVSVAWRHIPPSRDNRFMESFVSIDGIYFLTSAPFTIVSFPFLFSLMFGDAGHGTLMLLAALWMVLFEKKLQQQKTDSEVRGRIPNNSGNRSRKIRS